MTMVAFPDRLTDASIRLKRAAAEIKETYQTRRPTVNGQATPDQLVEALTQFLSVAMRLDQEEGERGPIDQEDVSQLGDYGLAILNDLIGWATQLGLHGARIELEAIAVTASDWVARHEGEIRTLDPVVNALANIANQLAESDQLEELANFMGRILHASADKIKHESEKAISGRPWRVLHLNRGIVATRTHNPVLMEKVFDELVHQLPDEAPQFFSEGMQQMDALDYPAHVKEVMTRYFDTWTRPTMH
jgi:hypothetical protein